MKYPSNTKQELIEEISIDDEARKVNIMNKLSVQFAIVLSIIAILLPGGAADAKDEKGVTYIAMVRLKSELYNDLEKSFTSTLKNEFKGKVNIKTVSVDDKDVEAALKSVLADAPDMLVTFGTTPAKLACPLLKDRNIPLVYVGVTEPALIGIEDNKKSACSCTGVKWGVSPKVAFKFFEQVAPWAKKVAVLYNESFPQDETYVQQIKNIRKGIKYKLTFIPIANNCKDKILKLKKEDYDFFVPWYGFMRLESSMPQVKTLIVDKMEVPLFYGETLAGERMGAVVSIGPNLIYAGAQAAAMAKKIINGQSARDIPTEDPHKVFTIINMTMARKFGLKIPNQVLESAHKIITQ